MDGSSAVLVLSVDKFAWKHHPGHCQRCAGVREALPIEHW
jgi:hypothetical protein